MGFGWEFDAFFFLLAANGLAGVTCRLAAPGRWARRLCLFTIICDGLVLVGFLLAMMHGCRQAMLHKADPFWGLLLLPGALVFLAFLGLLNLYNTRYRK